MLTFFIDEPPQGKGRVKTATLSDNSGAVRMTVGKNGKLRPVLIHHTPSKTRAYEARIKTIAKRAMGKRPLMEGPVKLDLIFVMPIPSSWPAWKKRLALAGAIAHTAKPDLDNMEKAIKDAFNGVVWIDDCRVVSSRKVKLYEQPGRCAGTYCTIEMTGRLCAQISKKPFLGGGGNVE